MMKEICTTVSAALYVSDHIAVFGRTTLEIPFDEALDMCNSWYKEFQDFKWLVAAVFTYGHYCADYDEELIASGYTFLFREPINYNEMEEEIAAEVAEVFFEL